MPPPADLTSVSSKNMTLRYIESLEDRVKRLERREYLWISKTIAMWITVIGLVIKIVMG